MPQYDTDSIIGSSIIKNNSFTLGEVWIIISILLAVIGGMFIYSNYLSKEKEGKYTGYKKVIYDFFNFKITIIEPIFRMLYVICTIALTLGSFSLIGKNFFSFIGVLVFGNLALRLSFEFILLVLYMFKNIDSINKRMPSKVRIKEEDKKEDEKKEKKEKTDK